MEHLKLIWDFRGPASAPTAAHHLIHLKAYVQLHKIDAIKMGTETLNDMHSLAYMVVTKAQMPAIRDALKPHRGQLYKAH